MGPNLGPSILTWVSYLPDSGRSETKSELNIFEKYEKQSFSHMLKSAWPGYPTANSIGVTGPPTRFVWKLQRNFKGARKLAWHVALYLALQSEPFRFFAFSDRFPQIIAGNIKKQISVLRVFGSVLPNSSRQY